MFLDGIFGYIGQNETNATNRNLANQNIAFQQRENEITRSREDNAVQRSAFDLQQAGLSKTLAAGNPASAQALTAPQNNYQHVSPLSKIADRMDIAERLLNLQSQKKSVEEKQAQIENIKSQTEGNNLTNSTYLEKFSNDQSLIKTQIEATKIGMQLNRTQAELNKVTSDSMAEKLNYEIDNLIVENQYKHKSIEKLSSEIAHTLKANNKLDSEVAAIVEDIAYKKLQQDSLTHDLDYAVRYDLPVGQILNGKVGSIVNTVRSSADHLARNYVAPWLDKLLHVSERKAKKAEAATSGGGGHAW